MSNIPISNLPQEIDVTDAVAQCYDKHIHAILDAMEMQQSTLVECDKLIVNDLLVILRRHNKMRNEGKKRRQPLEMRIVDHRAGGGGATVNAADALASSIRQLSEAVAGLDQKTCAVVVPNFDLLVSSDQTNSHLDLLTRDLMAILHENPDLVLVGFKDPLSRQGRPTRHHANLR